MKKLNSKNLHQAKTATGTFIAKRLKIADSFFTRLVGLLAHKKLDQDEGMYFTKCSSVHTLFMTFPIDVVFLNSEKKVVAIESLKPWRLSKVHFKAKDAIEIPFGSAKNLNLQVGDQVEVYEC